MTDMTNAKLAYTTESLKGDAPAHKPLNAVTRANMARMAHHMPLRDKNGNKVHSMADLATPVKTPPTTTKPVKSDIPFETMMGPASDAYRVTHGMTTSEQRIFHND